MLETTLYTLAAVTAYLAAWYAMTAGVWQRYLAVMALRRARDNGGLTAASKLFGYPVAVQAVLIDALYNVLFGWFPYVFLGNPIKALPREWMYTHRLERHIADGGLRGRVAQYFCRKLLDPFDPDGQHCD